MSDNNYQNNLDFNDNFNNLENITNISLNNNEQSFPIINQELPISLKETVINFNLDNNEKKKNSRNYNISPIIRKTPNSKSDIIIQKIYTNRKNVIRNYQNTLSNSSTNFLHHSYTQKDTNDIIYNNSNVLLNLKSNEHLNNLENENNNLRISYINNSDKSNNNSNNNKNNESPFSENKTIKDITNKKLQDNSSSESLSDKSLTSLSDEFVNRDLTKEINIEKRKRKYYRTFKYKNKDSKISKLKPININEIETQKSSPSQSPRDISQDLWNDSVENYYIEFQKLCKDEACKYKNLSHRNELISNILKFILLISGCFTFTLSISAPNSIFMNTTTTISSCLTASITSVKVFFQFDKNSEIQYNIYRELDKLHNTISLEMLKPTYMRADPYEFILSLRNRKDELLKTLQKNN
jgi:hypothetical protein